MQGKNKPAVAVCNELIDLLNKHNEINPPKYPPDYAKALMYRTAQYIADQQYVEDIGITPTNDLIILRKISSEESTSTGGIVLTGAEDTSAPWKGVVLAVGPGAPVKLSPISQDILMALDSLLRITHSIIEDGMVRSTDIGRWRSAYSVYLSYGSQTQRMPMQVKIGDTVLFSRNAAQEFSFEGDRLLVLREGAILGVLDNDE